MLYRLFGAALFSTVLASPIGGTPVTIQNLDKNSTTKATFFGKTSADFSKIDYDVDKGYLGCGTFLQTVRDFADLFKLLRYPKCSWLDFSCKLFNQAIDKLRTAITQKANAYEGSSACNSWIILSDASANALDFEHGAESADLRLIYTILKMSQDFLVEIVDNQGKVTTKNALILAYRRTRLYQAHSTAMRNMLEFAFGYSPTLEASFDRLCNYKVGSAAETTCQDITDDQAKQHQIVLDEMAAYVQEMKPVIAMLGSSLDNAIKPTRGSRISTNPELHSGSGSGPQSGPGRKSRISPSLYGDFFQESGSGSLDTEPTHTPMNTSPSDYEFEIGDDTVVIQDNTGDVEVRPRPRGRQFDSSGGGNVDISQNSEKIVRPFRKSNVSYVDCGILDVILELELVRGIHSDEAGDMFTQCYNRAVQHVQRLSAGLKTSLACTKSSNLLNIYHEEFDNAAYFHRIDLQELSKILLVVSEITRAQNLATDPPPHYLFIKEVLDRHMHEHLSEIQKRTVQYVIREGYDSGNLPQKISDSILGPYSYYYLVWYSRKQEIVALHSGLQLFGRNELAATAQALAGASVTLMKPPRGRIASKEPGSGSGHYSGMGSGSWTETLFGVFD